MASGIAKIDAHIATLTRGFAEGQCGGDLRGRMSGTSGDASRTSGRRRQPSPYHTRSKCEAVKEFDVAVGRIEDFFRKRAEQTETQGRRIGKAAPPPPAVKKKRVVEPAKLVQSPYLETKADVDGFLDKLRKELEQAIAHDERIEIR